MGFSRTKSPNVIVPPLRFQGRAYEGLLRMMQEERWEELGREFLVEGRTGTGKTLVILACIKLLMREFDGFTAIVLRKVKTDLGASFMKAWEEVILEDEDLWDQWMLHRLTGRIPDFKSRDVYRYPNGSALFSRGMNQRERVKSMEYDFVYMMEATEFAESDVTMMHTRVRPRTNCRVPWQGIVLDCNPSYPQHWLNRRADKAFVTRIKTTLRDNPGYFNLRKNELTELGVQYDSGLREALDGPDYSRNVQGLWVAAEGQILHWEESIHEFEGDLEPNPKGHGYRIRMHRTHPVLGDFVDIEWFGASYDWGKKHAGTLQIWAFDKANRQFLIEEWYHSDRPPHWWADVAVQMWRKYSLPVIVCDSAASDSIATFNRRIREIGKNPKAEVAIPCAKRQGNKQQSNMEVLVDAFSNQPDGKPAVYIKRDALAHKPDRKLPNVYRLTDEIPGYVYAAFEEGRHTGRPEDRPDRSCVDDGLDACTYMRVFVQGGRKFIGKVEAPEPQLDARELAIRNYKAKMRRAA